MRFFRYRSEKRKTNDNCAWDYSKYLGKNKNPSVNIMVPQIRFATMYILGSLKALTLQGSPAGARASSRLNAKFFKSFLNNVRVDHKFSKKVASVVSVDTSCPFSLFIWLQLVTVQTSGV